MDDFIVRALIAGIGVAVLCGPLGCLVVWQRMAYFGAALSHAALLGITLGLFFKLNLVLAILIVCIALSCLLVSMERYRHINTDTALGILAHGSLALGIVLLGIMPTVRVDLMAYLFGDILSTSWPDIAWIYGGGACVLLALKQIWPPILSLIIQRDLALVDGIDERRTRMIFLVLLSFVVAIGMQIVGILLVVSLLIIPVAAARYFSSSPEQMAVVSAVIGVLSVIGGLAVSLLLDTPTGPSIVVAACIIYLACSLQGSLTTSTGRQA